MAREGWWQRHRREWSDKAPWYAGVCLAFTVHWSAGGIEEFFQHLMRDGHINAGLSGLTVAYLFLCWLSFRWLYRVRRQLFRPRTRLLRNEHPEQRAHLILFLSNLPGALPHGIPPEVTLSDDLRQDLESLKELKELKGIRWPWEMPLRSIAHHLGSLRTVTILCSQESIKQAHLFAHILAQYKVLQSVTLRLFLHQQHSRPVLLECPETPQSLGGWDFEHFDELSEAVSQLLDELHEQHVHDSDIMIDFTGGQKVTSVVATAVTFNRPIKAQYVQTNPPYGVISYDIMLGMSEGGPGIG